MAAYRCVTAVLHNGLSFAPGDAIDVAEEWLAPLLRVGAVEKVEGAMDELPPPAYPPGAVDLLIGTDVDFEDPPVGLGDAPGVIGQTNPSGGAEDAPAALVDTADRTYAPLNSPPHDATQAEGAPSASRRKPKSKT